jgi:hypothetical protein
MLVMELVQPLPAIEVLVGQDLLFQWLLISDGPGGDFTISS